MKTYKSVLLAAVVLTTAPVWAQQSKKSGITTRSQAVVDANKAQLPDRVTVPENVREILSTRRVDITLNSATAEEALKQLLDASGCSYDFDTAFYPSPEVSAELNRMHGANTMSPVIVDLPARLITMKLVNAYPPNALDSVCKALGVGWTATVPRGDEVPTIHIVRLSGTVTRTDLILRQSATVRGTGLNGGGFGGLSGGLGGGGLGSGGVAGNDERIRFLNNPLKRVSVDAKDKSAQETIAAILKTAQIEYALDLDTAQTKNITVTLKDVTLRTALDAVCESAGLGWTVESSANPSKPVVRVGKQYAPDASKRTPD